MPILVRPLKSDDQYTNTSYDYQITQEIKYGTPSPTMLLTNKCANTSSLTLQFATRVNSGNMYTKIPYKTSLQLKQYFQKSFSKRLFENINNCCKQRIMEMTQAMPQSRPSEIVDSFLVKVGNKVYFRREVLELVKYFQRAVE
ncbi:Hypothetical_protein [Hexamita inflata]|uniref:Hypothetical_protein n=1 Tax=Hexamita inflata TaxID=28002 RepID=A0AA86UNY1_9EUKA|nr:Hypothetical protein HINF_LOCUS49994 [Hexamita inflata]